MGERSTKVVLSAQVAGYVTAMHEATKATRETGSAAEKLSQQKQAFETMGRAAMGFGVIAAAGAGFAIKKFADFDAAMSAVQAATMESESSMRLLSDAAMDAGARTVFSAEESANAIEELAKAGVSTADVLSGGLDGALDLAAAGNLGVADAAGIAATALKTFNLQGSDMAHVADLLAAGAGKAMGDVSDLSQALNQSAMVANATGLSIEETTAGLAAFASQGLLGSDAGTSFKSMLQSLTPTSKKAAEEMERLGISAYDSQGNFIGLAEFAGKLRAGLQDLTVEQQQAAMKTIFGSDAIRAATVLYSEGEEGIREWITAVSEQGYAAEQARARLDNLKGDIEALGGALDTALISTGSVANDTLREMVQWLTSAVDVYNDLPEPLQSATLGVGLLSAGVGILGGGLSLALPKFVEFWGAMNTLGITSKTASEALAGMGRFLTGPWGVAITGAAAVAAVLLGEKQKMVTNSKELAATLDSETGAVTDNSKAWAANKLESEGLLERGERLGISAQDLTDAWLGNADAIGRVNDRMKQWQDADFRMKNADWDGWSKDIALVQLALDGSNEMLAEAKEKHDRLKDATQESGDAAADAAGNTTTQGDALAGMAGEAGAAADAVSELTDLIRNFGSAQFDVEKSAVAFQDALASLQGELATGTSSWDITTEAGRRTRNVLLDLATDTNSYAAAMHASGASVEEYSGVLDQGREALYNSAIAAGAAEDEARRFADTLIATPEFVETYVAVDTQEAHAKIAAINADNPPEKILQISANAVDAYAGIEGVNVMKIDDKTAYVWGDNADAVKKIDDVNATRPLDKKVWIGADDSGFRSVWQSIANLGPIQKMVNFVTGKKPDGNANGGMYAYANGGIEAYANGGFPSGIYKGGTPIHKFAEPETLWEAYISGKPSERDRNRQIWVESGERLGAFASLERKLETLIGNSGSRINMGGVTFTQPSQRSQFRDLEDTMHRIERGL